MLNESKKIIIERCSVMYKTISRKYYNRDILFNKKNSLDVSNKKINSENFSDFGKRP